MNKIHTSRALRSAACLLLAQVLSNSVQALPSTDSLNGWTSLGDVVAQGGVLSLTTASTDVDFDPAGNLSGNSAVSAELIEPAAGLPSWSLNLSTSDAMEGSLLSQSFSVVAGQTLSFNWAFSTAETLDLDHAFVAINGELFTLATGGQPGGSLQTFSYTFGSSGTATLALGVVDTSDFSGVSQLNISNIQISAVPEPGAMAMMLAGLGAVGLMVRRRQRRD